MNRGGFSWKRALGISAAKSRVSRRIGIPLTKSGRQRKIGRAITGGGCLLNVLLCAGLLAWHVRPAHPAPSGTELHRVESIALPGVEGRIDHMSIDLATRRLFVAALGNNSIEVLDLERGGRLHRILDLKGPQGVVFAPDLHRLFVADGGDGSVRIYDSRTYEQKGAVLLSGDADNVRYTASTGRVYVGCGAGGIAVIDAAKGELLRVTPLGGHPESFQLERHGDRIFVNLPSKDCVAVIRRDGSKVVARWPLAGARENFPMALDEDAGRLFVACREPARLLIYDVDSGRVVESLALDGDPDDVFLDTARNAVYVSCGAGYLDLVRRVSPDSCSLADRLPTASGARTCLYVPQLDRLYLAVPHRGKQQAGIWVYAAGIGGSG